MRCVLFFFFSSKRRHTRFSRDWSSDVCSSDLTAGQPIVAVATLNPVRIVGYLRPPIMDEPKPGMKVEVRTRGVPRVVGSAHIVEVGTQLEAVPATLLGPMKLANTELGLPV